MSSPDIDVNDSLQARVNQLFAQEEEKEDQDAVGMRRGSSKMSEQSRQRILNQIRQPESCKNVGRYSEFFQNQAPEPAIDADLPALRPNDMQQANSLHFDDMSNSVRSSAHSSGDEHPHGVPDLINARKKIACRFGVRAKLYAIQEEASENNSSSMVVIPQ